jgi:hypothetical protein
MKRRKSAKKCNNEMKKMKMKEKRKWHQRNGYEMKMKK